MKKTFRQEKLVELHQILINRFDEGELRNLCFHLGLDYDNLAGVGKADKARELVTFLNHQEQISKLIREGKKLRPDIDWDNSNITPVKEGLSEVRNDQPEQSGWHWALRTLSVLILVSSLLWFAIEPSFEPLIGLLGGIGGLIVYKRNTSKGVDLVITGTLVILFVLSIIVIFSSFNANGFPTIEVRKLPNKTQIEVTWKNLPLTSDDYSNYNFFLVTTDEQWFYKHSLIRQAEGTQKLALGRGISHVAIIAVPDNVVLRDKVMLEDKDISINLIAQASIPDQ